MDEAYFTRDPSFMDGCGSLSTERQAHIQDGVYRIDCINETPHTTRSRSKPIPPPLVFQNDVANLLTEFAIIATSPRSPLMQRNLPIRKRAYSCSSMESGHLYVKQPLTPPPSILSPPPSQASPTLNGSLEDITPQGDASLSQLPTSGGCEANSSDLASAVVENDSQDLVMENRTLVFPVPAWHCFMKGTRIRFVGGHDYSNKSAVWHLAEELCCLGTQTNITDLEPGMSLYAKDSLCLVEATEKSNGAAITALLHLYLRPLTSNQNDRVIEVECSVDHPFYIKDGGWSSARPELTELRYGIHCRPLQVKDICLPPPSTMTVFSSDMFERIKSFDFTPEDTSAILALSNMAKHKHEQNSNNPMTLSPPASPTKKYQADGSNKPKRPMNAFMLFAKHHRVEYTQMHPGKDNRAISVLLGDTWKRMSTEERNCYAQKAKVLAEEQKKRYPDCWKRRRSLSTSS